jgi:hypothetical protein
VCVFGGKLLLNIKSKHFTWLCGLESASSCNHGQLRTCELLIEEPVTHIDGQVNLFALDYLNFTLVFLHIDCNEFIADFRGMLSTVGRAEWLLFKLLKVFWLSFCIVLFALSPSDFVQAFAEEDDEGKDSLVERVVDLLGDIVEVEGENFVNEHLQFLILGQVVVVSSPALSLPVTFFCVFIWVISIPLVLFVVISIRAVLFVLFCWGTIRFLSIVWVSLA